MHSTPDSFSSAALRQIVGDDLEMLGELRDAFEIQSPTVLADMRSAIAGGNARLLADAAHLMGNVVAMAGGIAGREISRRIEHSANRGDMHEAAALVELQAADLALLGDALATFVCATTSTT